MRPAKKSSIKRIKSACVPRNTINNKAFGMQPIQVGSSQQEMLNNQYMLLTQSNNVKEAVNQSVDDYIAPNQINFFNWEFLLIYEK